MTEEENMWLSQIAYNNSWPKQTSLSTQAASIFLQRLQEKGWPQLLCPVVANRAQMIPMFTLTEYRFLTVAKGAA